MRARAPTNCRRLDFFSVFPCRPCDPALLAQGRYPAGGFLSVNLQGLPNKDSRSLFPDLSRGRGSALALLLFALSTAACTVQLISDYDEVLDKAASDLQVKVEAFLIKMQATARTPDGEYAKNTSFYDEAKVALSAMRLRAESTPKNEITVEQIGLLEKNIENLRQLHEGAGPAGLSKTVVMTTRTLLNTQFKAILTLEIAKKRGRA